MDLDSGSDEEVGATIVAAREPTSVAIEAKELGPSASEATSDERAAAQPQTVAPPGRDRDEEMEMDTSALVEGPAAGEPVVEQAAAEPSTYIVKQEQPDEFLQNIKDEPEEMPLGNGRSTALSFSWASVDVTMDVETLTPPPRPAADVINETRSFFDTLDATIATSNAPHPLPARPQTPSELPAREEEEEVKPSITRERRWSTPPRDTEPFISRLPPTSTSASTPPAPAIPPQLVFRPYDFVPARHTSNWSILYVVGLEYGMESDRVWTLLSPSHLPRPVAINIIRVSASRITLANAAYSNLQDSDLAKEELTGTVCGREGSKVVVVDYDTRRGEIGWRWEMASDEFKALAASGDLPSNAKNPTSRRPSLPPRPPSPLPSRPSLPSQNSPSYPQP